MGKHAFFMVAVVAVIMLGGNSQATSETAQETTTIDSITSYYSLTGSVKVENS